MFQNQRFGLKGWWTCLYSALVALACWWPDFAGAQPGAGGDDRRPKTYYYMVLPKGLSAELHPRFANSLGVSLSDISVQMPRLRQTMDYLPGQHFSRYILIADGTLLADRFVTAFSREEAGFLRFHLDHFDDRDRFFSPMDAPAGANDFLWARGWFKSYLKSFSEIYFIQGSHFTHSRGDHRELIEQIFLPRFNLGMANHYLTEYYGPSHWLTLAGSAGRIVLEYLASEDFLVLAQIDNSFRRMGTDLVGCFVPSWGTRIIPPRPFLHGTEPLFDAFDRAASRLGPARLLSPPAAAPRPSEGVVGIHLPPTSRITNAPGLSAAGHVASSSSSSLSSSSSSSSSSSGPASLSCSCCPGGNHIQRHH